MAARNGILRSTSQTSLALLVGLAPLACDPPHSSVPEGAGGHEAAESGDDAAVDAGEDESDADGEAEPDASDEPPADAAAEEPDAVTDVGPPPPPEAHEALCTDAYDSVALDHPNVIRGSWQYNPGGAYVTLPENGYPCRAFLYDGEVRPKADDPRWTDADNGEFLGFSEHSTVPESNYSVAQFRYFRSLIFVPQGQNLKSLTVSAAGIDDAIYLELHNSLYPKGISPRDAGPSDPEVGACQGNDSADWDLKDYMVEGEVNLLFLVHADMNPATSTLTSVEIRADGAPIQIVSCKD